MNPFLGDKYFENQVLNIFIYNNNLEKGQPTRTLREQHSLNNSHVHFLTQNQLEEYKTLNVDTASIIFYNKDNYFFKDASIFLEWRGGGYRIIESRYSTLFNYYYYIASLQEDNFIADKTLTRDPVLDDLFDNIQRLTSFKVVFGWEGLEILNGENLLIITIKNFNSKYLKEKITEEEVKIIGDKEIKRSVDTLFDVDVEFAFWTENINSLQESAVVRSKLLTENNFSKNMGIFNISPISDQSSIYRGLQAGFISAFTATINFNKEYNLPDVQYFKYVNLTEKFQ